MRRVTDMLLGKVKDYEALVESHTKIEDVAKDLIRIKDISDSFTQFKSEIDKIIDTLLYSYRVKFGGASAIAKLGVLLNKDIASAGQAIISEHKCFQGYSLSIFNTKTQNQGIDYVLKYIEGDNLNKKQLKEIS